VRDTVNDLIDDGEAQAECDRRERRDWFASNALIGILSGGRLRSETAAKYAVVMADLLIEALDADDSSPPR